ncbi:uncharacterized protein N7477_002372 [Penicillium maclennaniae]|uniref:uncharacterized protein n=1 Tax=Penicillium maclennaniae TaxID=1343394 RepID=UPI002540FF47|nr:uncharacterized protein N7477_002372 [Penicillium maclennaniae]KAJ5676739.1 hypothetical protein N7477_002372 [Penicillium maclennaniae]
MATTTNPDGSEDVNDFLLRIRELGEQRDKEDQERTKRLEDEILQGRAERQARRAASTIDRRLTIPKSLKAECIVLGQPSIEPPEHLEPTVQTQDPETATSESTYTLRSDERRGSVQDSGMESPRAMPTLQRSRTGTLSWQQRPSSRDSRDFGNRSPGSTSPTRSSQLRNASPHSDENLPSRAQITNSLGSKDPSWFRQTPDRGLGSPALRKLEDRRGSQVELGMSRQLPGMSRESTVEPEKADVAEEIPLSPPRTASTIGESSSKRYSSVSSASPPGELDSPPTLTDAPKLDPTLTEPLSVESVPTPPPQRRMSPDRARSTSPTKGLGGFVQSAMMRRSDSVSKRWSAQLPQGLSRSNSIISHRNSVAAPSLTGSIGDLAPTTSALQLNRDTSQLPTQRPGSSYGETTVHPSESIDRPMTPTGNTSTFRSEGSPSRSVRYGHSRTASTATVDSQSGETSSPFTSRTMDPRRWSPNKASWLESALNRPNPETPRQATPQQPAWVRERQSRGSVDMGRVRNFKEVTPAGLMRTPPPGGHFKKPSLSAAPSVFDTPNAGKTKEAVVDFPFPTVETGKPPTTKLEAAEDKPTEGLSEECSEEIPEEKPETNPEPVSEQVEEETKPISPIVPESEPPESEAEPVKLSTPEPTRKLPPLNLSPKPNFSLPSRALLSPKPKQQSPVVDFRANLRKREVVKDSGPEKEPEFKNVFGKLKKTETRNYQAPDELKGNILRGKAALNITGGPKKTERVDEFRHSLVMTKEAMKAGGGSIRRNTIEDKEVPTEVIPEAIAKRHTMTKSSSFKRTSTDEPMSPATKDAGSTPTSPNKLASPARTFGGAIDMEAPRGLSPTFSEPKAAVRDSLSSPILSPSQDEPSNDIVETIEPTMEKERKGSTESASSMRGLPSARIAAAAAAARAASPVMSMSGQGKLAGRINPALVGLLSRGPLPAEGPKKEVVVSSLEGNDPSSPAAPLTHITKGRARGPKRRLPKGDASTAVSSVQDTEVGAISSPEFSPQTSPEPVIPSETQSESVSRESLVIDTEPAQIESPVAKPLPPVNTTTTFQDVLNSGLQRLRSISPISSSFPKDSSTRSSEDSVSRDIESPRPDSPSTRPPVPPKPSPSPSHSPSPAPRNQWSQQSRYASASPSPLRTSFRENVPGVMVATSSPQDKRLPSPPESSKQLKYSLGKPADHRLSRKMSAPSLVAQAADAREVIGNFFKTFPSSRDRMDIDPQLMLTTQADAAKIRTLKRQIWEFTGDGKRQEVPVNQEYVLYEGSMYLCVHLFEAHNSNHSEVYLWCGDDVSEAALDDAQLFARKVARENGCKLELIRQGKEPVRFIQALGGIIITRRGQNSRHTSSSLYMLCGRKHLGQMAFDEVDYSLRNLCSGFPFVISAPFGKLYLWKGKGSGPEETGAARLISMDLGLTGEFEEVDEGQEPDCFFDDFAGSNETNPLMTPEYWKLKSKYDHYRTRLLRIDHQLGQPTRFWGMRRPGSGSPVVRPNDCVQEIEPFCFKDLTERDVFVLDTFFEIYVIVGDHTSQKSAEFASAVVFAHEYGILAASLQDRPFIPKSFVALGGVPDRCQSAFRKWDRRSIHAPCVFPLDVAIEAIRSQERGE